MADLLTDIQKEALLVRCQKKLDNGFRVEAVREYRRATGCSLAAAMKALGMKTETGKPEMTQAIDITSLVQTLASYGVPSDLTAKVRELGTKADLYAELFDAGRNAVKEQNAGSPNSHDELVGALMLLATSSSS